MKTWMQGQKVRDFFYNIWRTRIGCLNLVSGGVQKYRNIYLLLPPGDPVWCTGILAGGGAAGLAGAALALDQAELETGDQDRTGEQRKENRKIKVFFGKYIDI